MPSPIHEVAVARILRDYPRAKPHGLMREIRAALPASARPDFKFMPGIPDAFIVDRENKTVMLFEVEAGHPVGDIKMQNYSGLFWRLDGEEWDLGLVIVDRWGLVVETVDVGMFAIRSIVHEVKQSGRGPDAATAEWGRQIKRSLAEQSMP